MEEDQVRKLKELVETDVDSVSEPDSLESAESLITPDEHIHIYKDVDDNPYQVIDVNTTDHVYQVLGNEIIMITKGEGVCCLCQQLSIILYTDNSYNNNIPVQVCKSCIDNMFK